MKTEARDREARERSSPAKEIWPRFKHREEPQVVRYPKRPQALCDAVDPSYSSPRSQRRTGGGSADLYIQPRQPQSAGVYGHEVFS